MNIDLVLTVSSLVKTVITSVLQVKRILEEAKENEVEAGRMIDQLQSIQAKLEEQEKRIKNNEVPREMVETDVLQTIKKNFVEIDDKIMSVLTEIRRRKPNKFSFNSLKVFMESGDYSQAMQHAHQLILDCQNRLEQYKLINVTVSVVQEGFEALKKRTPEDFNLFENKLHQRFDEIQQAIDKQPMHNVSNTLNNRLVEFENLLHKLYNSISGNVVNENHDMMENDEIACFEKILDNISMLSKSELQSEESTKLIEQITSLWNQTWKIDESVSVVLYNKDRKGNPKRIGSGATGIVYSGTFQETNESEKVPVAIKDITISESSDIRKQCAELLRQAIIHKYLDHPCIVKLYGVVWPVELTINGDVIDDEDDNDEHQASFVMEKLKCNLEVGAGRLTREKDRIRVLKDTSQAISYLHSKNIVHRDLKAQNILIDLDTSGNLQGNAKLCDFGISKHRHDETNNPILLTTTTISRGTPLYRPPETFMPHYEYTKPSWDVWSFGILIAVTLVNDPTKQPRFDVSRMFDYVQSGNFQTRIEEWINLIENRQMKDVASFCLEKEEENRPKMAEVSERIKEIYNVA